MTTDMLYDDGRVALDDRGVTLRRYYFPFGTSKRIPYDRIRAVEVRSMSWATGKGRIWGTSRPGYWFPLDGGRPNKDTLLVLDVGGPVKPAISPDDPDRVRALITERARL